QNPIEYEGTYPLPEAQLDRFLMKVLVPYPSRDTEIQMLHHHAQGFNPNLLELSGIQAIGGEEIFMGLRDQNAQIRVSSQIEAYLADLLIASRNHELVLLGASPRAGVALLQTARTVAGLEGRDYVVPDDLKEILPSVWRHRLILRPEAEIEGISPDRVLAEVAERVPVPR
ncbi:MAG TPA: MoxR family ATPase, partial [bacterium]|nr:MoxR family ATPase [bacterium]